jgi:hypothetical protein
VENWTPEQWTEFVKPIAAGIKAGKAYRQLVSCSCCGCINSFDYLKVFVKDQDRSPSFNEAQVSKIYFTCLSPRVRAMR